MPRNAGDERDGNDEMVRMTHLPSRAHVEIESHRLKDFDSLAQDRIAGAMDAKGRGGSLERQSSST